MYRIPTGLSAVIEDVVVDKLLAARGRPLSCERLWRGGAAGRPHVDLTRGLEGGGESVVRRWVSNRGDERSTGCPSLAFNR